MQVVSGDWSNYGGAKGDGRFGEGRPETSRIARRTSGVEDKSSSYKGAYLKPISYQMVHECIQER